MKTKRLRLALCIAGGLFAYVLSAGPAWALASHGVISNRVFGVLYLPLVPLENHCPGDLFWRYENWWAPAVRF